MKQKRTFITLLLVIAILGLGIAYAAVTGVTLNIKGTASAQASDENFEVKFSETVEITTDQIEVSKEEITVTAERTDDLNATIGCSGLSTKGDWVSATYTIENASPELTAYLTASATCDNAAFNVETDWTEKSIPATEGSDTTTITVKITLNETVADDVSGNVTVTLTAGSVQPTEEEPTV